jgi:ATP-dependent helicase IRC3
MELRHYQREAISAVYESWLAGKRSGLVVLPTGSGKTIVFARIIADTPGRSLVLVHRDELVRQSVAKLHSVEPDLDVGIVQASRNECSHQVVVASVQTLSRLRRLAQMVADFRLVVTDEAHHATAESYRRISAHIGAGKPEGPYHLGVTATPARSDRCDLAGVFDSIIYEASMKELITAGYLADMRGKAIDVGINLDAVKLRHGDFRPEALTHAMLAANAPELIAKTYVAYGQGRRAIAFLPGVELADRVCQSLNQNGISSALVIGETPIEARQAIYAGLRAGAISVVCNCMVLTEGFDEPSVDCIIVGRPTKSLPLYTQMVGRGSRPFPSKDDCLVLDVVGISRRHKIQSLSDLFGTGQIRPGLSYLETLKAIEAEREADHNADGAKVRAEFVDIDLFLSSELAWVQTTQGHMTLALQDFSLLCATRRGDYWTLSHVAKGQPERVLGIGIFEGLQGAAIQFADENGSKWAVRKGAYWRQTPASEKQRAILLSMGYRLPPWATKGEASDLLASLLNDRVISQSRQLARRHGNRVAAVA